MAFHCVSLAAVVVLIMLSSQVMCKKLDCVEQCIKAHAVSKETEVHARNWATHLQPVPKEALEFAKAWGIGEIKAALPAGFCKEMETLAHCMVGCKDKFKNIEIRLKLICPEYKNSK